MRYIILNILFASIVMAGFFNDEAESEKAQVIENKRLCKLYRQKIDAYKQNMRDDILYKATLLSYQKRKSHFCSHATSVLKKRADVTGLLIKSAHKGS